mmetsp:Transcript_31747/g.37026  ORF Transcript_31747/g.37026 Transcript_31747/m.37026 type:complete len:245 (+) Transcript_31747:130-864(+)
MSSFGKWYDEQKSDSPSSASNTSSFNITGIFSSDSTNNDDNPENMSSMTLPLFNTPISVPTDISFSSIKSNLEAQMPQQVLGMSYQQRFKVFVSLLLLSTLFFTLAFFVGLPMITIRPQKFALSFTCGSLTFMGSFAILRGPVPHFSGMITQERLPFTTIYIGSMIGTLYCTFSAYGAKGYVSVMIMSGVQLMALIWYLVTFLPGGAQGMKVLISAMLAILRPVIVGCSKCCASIAMKLFGRAF